MERLEDVEVLQNHLKEFQHVHKEHDDVKGELHQQTYRSFAFRCFVLFLTLVQALAVWHDGDVLGYSWRALREHPHPERTMLKVVGAHLQTQRLQFVFSIELLLFLEYAFRRYTLSRRPLNRRHLFAARLLLGFSLLVHFGALGVRVYVLVAEHFSWWALLVAFLDFLWWALDVSTFFNFKRLDDLRNHAKYLRDSNPTAFAQ